MEVGDEVARVVLTASGGPFRTWSREQLERATPEEALKHPTWSMGKKVTIDSATLMNKALEIIEAHWLFGLSGDQIAAMVHPQSMVHALVEFCDGSVIAQLGSPDMRIPIAHALAWPERMPTPAERLDLVRIQSLDFEEPDQNRFPALRLAREALADGTAAPIVLNAANEVAVAAFLGRRIGFADIARTVERALATITPQPPLSIADVIDIDREVREKAHEIMPLPAN